MCEQAGKFFVGSGAWVDSSRCTLFPGSSRRPTGLKTGEKENMSQFSRVGFSRLGSSRPPTGLKTSENMIQLSGFSRLGSSRPPTGLKTSENMIQLSGFSRLGSSRRPTGLHTHENMSQLSGGFSRLVTRFLPHVHPPSHSHLPHYLLHPQSSHASLYVSPAHLCCDWESPCAVWRWVNRDV